MAKSKISFKDKKSKSNKKKLSENQIYKTRA